MSVLATPQKPFSEEEKLAIEAQVERLISTPFFNHSRRLPSFLRYVVTHTLAGNSDYLKERTLGIEIFGKDPDYDTANDPIVRVTAAEVRKRIAQYYQAPGHEHELRVALPPGSYVPTFQPNRPQTLIDIVEGGSPSGSREIPVEIVRSRPSTPPWRWLTAVAGILLALAIFWSFKARHSQPTAFAEFWSPILASTDPVLFCIADQTQYTAISLRDADDPTHLVTLNDNLTAVVIDDLSAVTKIAGVLQSAGKPYKLRGEGATTLSDLRTGPSIIIGAFDNAWTLRLLKPLRFHFWNTKDMTKFGIVDASTGQVRWGVDRTQQMTINNYRDYAIVARFTDRVTGQPTLIAAGIGRGGTTAAGEFLTNSELLQQAKAQITSPAAKNVEVVLSTQIIDGEPGKPTVEAVYYW